MDRVEPYIRQPRIASFSIVLRSGEPTVSDSSWNHESLRRKPREVVLPLYYDSRPGWIAVMKGVISKSASYFDSYRMMRRYISEAYAR